MNPLRIDIVSDVICPWCYIGKRRLEKAIAMLDGIPVELHWRPFLLNPSLPREGMDRSAYVEAKYGSAERYEGIVSRVAEAAASEDLEYNFKRITRTPNTVDAHRLIRWAGDLAGEMKQRLMDLYFRDGADLTNLDVLADAAASVGLDRAEIRARLASDIDVDEVTEEAQAASQAGITGVPTFILGGKYALSGAQPPEVLADAVRQILGKKDAAE